MARVLTALVDTFCFVGHAVVVCLCWLISPVVYAVYWLKNR